LSAFGVVFGVDVHKLDAGEAFVFGEAAEFWGKQFAAAAPIGVIFYRYGISAVQQIFEFGIVKHVYGHDFMGFNCCKITKAMSKGFDIKVF
jgi:hypothetical protein